jgi:hypothetical protein
VARGRAPADAAAAGALPGPGLLGAHVDAEQVDRPPGARRAPEERTAREGAGPRLADHERPRLGQGAPDARRVDRVHERAPDAVGDGRQPCREPRAERIGVQGPGLRFRHRARDERALAGAGHPGDEDHGVVGVAEDHDRRVAAGGQARLNAR